jgi:hypothetical protein
LHAPFHIVAGENISMLSEVFPRAKLAVQVGAKEHARLAINAARRYLDASELQAR